MDRDLQIWFIFFVVATAISATIQLVALQQYSTVARELVDNLKRSVNNAVEVSERMKDLVNEAAISQKQIGRVDRVIDDVLTRLERIGKSFEVGAAKLFEKLRLSRLPCAPRWAYSLAITALRPRASVEQETAPCRDGSFWLRFYLPSAV